MEMVLIRMEMNLREETPQTAGGSLDSSEEHLLLTGGTVTDAHGFMCAGAPH